jgi:hypothetical protein
MGFLFPDPRGGLSLSCRAFPGGKMLDFELVGGVGRRRRRRVHMVVSEGKSRFCRNTLLQTAISLRIWEMGSGLVFRS